MIHSEYIHDIVILLLDDNEYSLLRKQVEYLEAREYEFTKYGVFVSFKLDDEGLIYKISSEHLRLGGVLINSDEIDIAAEASIVIKNGLIDYLEIWSHGDIYPNKDPTHYRLEQHWKGEQNKVVIR